MKTRIGKLLLLRPFNNLERSDEIDSISQVPVIAHELRYPWPGSNPCGIYRPTVRIILILLHLKVILRRHTWYRMLSVFVDTNKLTYVAPAPCLQCGTSLVAYNGSWKQWNVTIYSYNSSFWHWGLWVRTTLTLTFPAFRRDWFEMNYENI